MNWDRIEGNWKQFTGKVKQQWGKLTDDDLQQVEGRRVQRVEVGRDDAAGPGEDLRAGLAGGAGDEREHAPDSTAPVLDDP